MFIEYCHVIFQPASIDHCCHAAD